MASRTESAMTPLTEFAAITTSGSAQRTALIGEGRTAVFVRLAATQNTYYRTSTLQMNMDATVNSPLLPAGAIEIIQVQAGGYISILSGGTSGTVSITLMV
jgi:hypothetical protein